MIFMHKARGCSMLRLTPSRSTILHLSHEICTALPFLQAMQLVCSSLYHHLLLFSAVLVLTNPSLGHCSINV